MPRGPAERTKRLPQEIDSMLEKFPNITITKLARNLDTTVQTLEKLLSEGKITKLPTKVTDARQRSVWGSKKDNLFS